MPLTLFYTMVQKSQKWPKTQIKGGPALNFFFESSWKNMKNDNFSVRMRSGDHLGDAKCRKRAPRSVEFNFFINCDRQKQFSQNERRRADLQNRLPQIF